MSAPAFTPGPWMVHATNRVVVQADGAFAPVTVKDGKVVGDDSDMPCSICLLRDPDDDFSEDETLANGFLIAAAPELYDALEKSLPFLGWAATRSQTICGVDAGDLYFVVEAALARARGEEGAK